MHFEVCVYLDLYTVPSVFDCSGVYTNRYFYFAWSNRMQVINV